MTASRLVTAFVITLCALAVGCGGDDKADDAPTLTKAEFVEKANAICEAGNKELADVAIALGPNTGEELLDTYVTATLVPNIRDQIEDIRALGFPPGDEDELTEMLDDTERVLDDIATDPTILNSPKDPFKRVVARLGDYGLTSCGSS